MATPALDDRRIASLSAFFNQVIHGLRTLSTSRNGKLFLEALCAQPDPAACAHKLITTPFGLSSLQASVRFDLSVTFLNNHAAPLLRYLQSPDIKSIGSGSVLTQLLSPLVEPPFFWEALVKSFIEETLNPEARQSFAWLLLQLISSQSCKKSSPYLALASSTKILALLLESPDGETRNLGQKIKHSLPLDASELHIDAEARPGGRHDNDFADHREISIMPTADELLSKDRPFFRTADFIENPDLGSSRAAHHIDNQFRLLREDMLGEIREELKILTGLKTGRHRGITICNLSISGINMGEDRKRLPWGIIFKVRDDLPQLKKIDASKRKKFLEDNRHILRQGSMACLLVDNAPLAFPTIYRDEVELSKISPTVTLQFADDATMSKALVRTKISTDIKLVQLDTAVFSYDPFLKRLQDMTSVPLGDEILHWKEDQGMEGPSFQPRQIVGKLEAQSGKDLKDLLHLEKSAILDQSQMESLITCLTQRVSLVQGPPGTGKSFTGALLAKILYDSTSEIILVACFTNHALDQFLEDLMDIGIPSASMIRLGGKSTERTKPLMIREQKSVKRTATQWARIDVLKQRLRDHEKRCQEAFKGFQNANNQKSRLMEHLEFLSDDLPFFETFTVPEEDEGGMKKVGKGGKKMGPFYLLDRWVRNQTDAGAFKDAQPDGSEDIWNMSPEKRQNAQSRWQKAILEELIGEIQNSGRQYNADQAALDQVFAETDDSIIKTKRIIACTTNGAAKYSASIQGASPGVVLVEEAGEILEAHVLTSLGPSTQQLIMIGDHKQLRPKCSYELSVAQGDGFDLNRSLFERLVLKGFPHVTLTQQHRMRPEISSMIRHLTYPDLTDAKSTLKRADMRGFRDNVIFVDHSHPELELNNARELRDGTSSKQNEFEAQMILKCVRYLAQQGYGSDNLVVLTPYLGQLKLLRDQLAVENDPILNDLDKGDLIRAGLLTDLTSKTSKPSLRLSTIDNYQGEEMDIVLVSMTRSNKSHDIGFMAEPERVNVLLSRARDGLIMIGNSDTFMHARKGKEVWRKVFDHLSQKEHIYEGFPVKCEKHPSRTAILSSPEDFESECPDGGCKEPCGVMLNCGLHKCPSSCHQLFNHSKIACTFVFSQKCPNGHNQTWECHGGTPLVCHKCEYDKRRAETKAKSELDEKVRRDAKLQKHVKELAKLEEQISQINLAMDNERLDKEHQAVLAQRRKDLEAAKDRTKKAQNSPLVKLHGINDGDRLRPNTSKSKNVPNTFSTQNPSTPIKSTPHRHLNLQNAIKNVVTHNKSPSKTEWQRQKDQENAINPAIDEIMEMIGLEKVKEQVLRIKAKVETSIRQGTDLKKERLGLVLLGNPGTGKTTVARHYAKVLTSLGILKGDGFVETTGSRLSHDGVAEVKKHLQKLESSEGGVYFIDEAYQLAEGHNFGGKTVLDYLLAEIENLTGRIVFVFAGYRKQMEKFFEHNPGLPSRLPYILHFEDYTDAELLSMLQYNMNRFYKSRIHIEDGPGGLYMRIAVRRLGRGRGKEGFGNARALENTFAKIRDRQADRLAKERREGLGPDDLYITKEDLIGPDPSKAMLNCDAWAKLQQLIGLKAVKGSVSFLIELVKTNYERELQEKEVIDVSLNRLFLGSPGTGKTTVAKLYGRILADIGMLSNGEVVVKNPSDFVGSVIGQSEANTKAILATTLGKVLIIDEAYMLYPDSGSGVGSGTDIYKTAVIDTLVAEVQNIPGDDRCVLLLGYEPQMEVMFQNVNPGLTRRFQKSDAFMFDDFTDPELQQILELKLRSQDLSATQQAISTAIDVLGRLRNGLNFGNGGDVENLLSKAKSNYQARQSALPPSQRSVDFVFEPEDFDLDYNRSASAEINLQALFSGVIGCDDIIKKLDGFVKVARGMRAQGLEPRGQIPMNFIFKGPPGTGKTTTARKFGQVFYDLGFLSQVEVVECSATDLIGQYIGQTGPKTIKQLERGLGKVLFVDEAYRLGEGHFAQEAINELVDSITKPRFAGKMVIILAGYDNDMNNLLRVNEGLSSRFADEVVFPSLTPRDCLHLLKEKLNQSAIAFPSMQEPKTNAYLLDRLLDLSKLPAWGNARDIQTLAKSMVRTVFQTNTTQVAELILPAEAAKKCIESMLIERRARAKVGHTPRSAFSGQAQPADYSPPAPQTGSGTTTSTESTTKLCSPEDEVQSPSFDEVHPDSRDPGVSDAIWQSLQNDKKLAELKAKEAEKEISNKEQAQRQAEAVENEAKNSTKVLDILKVENETEAQALHQKREETRMNQNEGQTKQKQEEAQKIVDEQRKRQAENEAKANELLRKREEARIRALEAKAEKEKLWMEVERLRIQESERKAREQRVQMKLREMGVCPVGYRWIKQSSGYRCAGGSHWVDNSSLGL